ncbi:hypothetical protein CRD60_05620 [Bifidobacterium aemilianum]|uniref:Uncharacterized protein n=2 Tax=Bifidobacterium aemilianum TaxID=2493120 RepID=A0A366KAL4_9BIFI|nr:hypothetical protein CRD60_05620 [Bifidobacterium aemilianum]
MTDPAATGKGKGFGHEQGDESRNGHRQHSRTCGGQGFTIRRILGPAGLLGHRRSAGTMATNITRHQGTLGLGGIGNHHGSGGMAANSLMAACLLTLGSLTLAWVACRMVAMDAMVVLIPMRAIIAMN